MDFVINRDLWKIEFKNKDELLALYKKQYEDEAYFVFGLTNKAEHCIYINKDMQKSQQIKTLKHELTHCYIWECGLYNVPNYNEEMVCDLVSSIHNFIDDVILDFAKVNDINLCEISRKD